MILFTMMQTDSMTYNDSDFNNRPHSTRKSIRSFMLLPLCLLLLLIIAASSCGSSKEKKNLLYLEEYMEQDPAGGLKSLDSIDPGSYNSDELKALHALLKSRAYDKNLIDISNDSLIKPAYDYYSASSDKPHRLKAEYYMGIVNLNAGKYDVALSYFLDAYYLALQLSDSFWQGMASRNIAMVFNRTAHSNEELEFALISYYSMLKTKKVNFMDYTILQLCIAFSNNEKPDSCAKYAKELFDLSRQTKNKWLESQAIEMLGISYIKNKNYEKAIGILKQNLRDNDTIEYPDLKIRYYLALAYLKNGDFSKGLSLINDRNKLNSISDDFLEHELYCALEDTVKAYKALSGLHKKTTDNFKKRQASNLGISILKYHNTQKELDRAKMNGYKIKIILISLLFLLGSIIITILTYLYIHKQKIVRLELVRSAENLSTRIQEYECKNNKLADSVKQLLSSHFQIVNRACQTIHESIDDKTAEKRIAKNMKNLIQTIANDNDTIKELECLLNVHCQNLMLDFKNDFKELSKNDYRLFFLVDDKN